MAGKKTVRHKSALKAARQALRHQARNRSAMSQVKTAVKNLRTALQDKSFSAEKLIPLFNHAQKMLMTAAQKKILKRETASRKVSRLAQSVHQHGSKA